VEIRHRVDSRRPDPFVTKVTQRATLAGTSFAKADQCQQLAHLRRRSQDRRGGNADDWSVQLHDRQVVAGIKPIVVVLGMFDDPHSTVSLAANFNRTRTIRHAHRAMRGGEHVGWRNQRATAAVVDDADTFVRGRWRAVDDALG
jgi:hypothetical protein